MIENKNTTMRNRSNSFPIFVYHYIFLTFGLVILIYKVPSAGNSFSLICLICQIRLCLKSFCFVKNPNVINVDYILPILTRLIPSSLIPSMARAMFPLAVTQFSLDLDMIVPFSFLFLNTSINLHKADPSLATENKTPHLATTSQTLLASQLLQR